MNLFQIYPWNKFNEFDSIPCGYLETELNITSDYFANAHEDTHEGIAYILLSS